MNIFKAIFHSSLGKKYIMGLTGLALFGFVIGHMVGNLQIFLGQDKLNAYGAFLKSMPKLLWIARIGLLACVGLHIWAAVKLVRENRAARPDRYKQSGHDDKGRHDIYKMVVLGFSNPFSAAFYLIANCLLCIHLSHGVKSLFQSLGLSTGQFRSLFNGIAAATAWIIFIGNTSIPLAVLLGFGEEVLK